MKKKDNTFYQNELDYDQVWKITESNYCGIKYEYKNAKAHLKAKQKLLFLKYILAIKKYEMIANKYKVDNNTLIDDLIVGNNIFRITHDIRYSFNDKYILEIDKEKYNNAKEELKKEIERIRNVIGEMILSEDNYISNYTDDEIKNFLIDSDDIESIIETNNKIKASKIKNIAK